MKPKFNKGREQADGDADTEDPVDQEIGIAFDDGPIRAAKDPSAAKDVMDGIADEKRECRRRYLCDVEMLHHQPQQDQAEDEYKRADDGVAREKQRATATEQPGNEACLAAHAWRAAGICRETLDGASCSSAQSLRRLRRGVRNRIGSLNSSSSE